MSDDSLGKRMKEALDNYNKLINDIGHQKWTDRGRGIFAELDPDYLYESDPEAYFKRKENMIKNSELYEKPKENKLECDSGESDYDYLENKGWPKP